jgi:serine/threonine protein kinase
MPAPAALAYYGAVGITAGLCELLLKFLDDFTSLQDNVESLRLKVRYDLDLIQRFMVFFKDLPAEHGSAFDHAVLHDLADYLQPLMIRCGTEMNKIRAATAGKTLIEAYKSRLAIQAVETIEKDLESWVRRLNVRVTLLSEKLKLDTTQTVGMRDPALHFQYKMQNISSEINRLRANGQSIDHQYMWLSSVQSVDFGGRLRQRRMNGLLAGQKVLVEFVSYNATSSVEAAQEAIGELAFILNRSDPSIFHILRCNNVFEQQNTSTRSATYGLVFQIPPGLDSIRPLSDIVADEKEDRARFAQSVASQTLAPDVKTMRKIGSKNRVAYKLAVSLRYIHSFGYVHQSIRSSNVLIGSSENLSFVEVFLGGFERSRPNAAASNQRRIDADWRNNNYRSPDRVATTDEETIKRHTMSHDIYSLGAVLLELGMLDPLILMESKFKNKTAAEVRNNLKKLASEELIETMGDGYAEVVLYCLESTPDSWLAAHVAEMSYVDKVLGPLEQLSRLI